MGFGKFFTYIIKTKDGKYYTGQTNNLPVRVGRHKKGTGAKYVKDHGFGVLAYFERHNSRSEAMRREKEIKKMNHNQKANLRYKKK